MIGFIGRLAFGIVKKIVFTILLIVGLVWYFFFKDANLDYKGMFAGAKIWIADSISWVAQNVKVEMEPNKIPETISPEVKEGIDAWLVAQNLNQYGDPRDRVYAGGSPLFNEATGETTDRYYYILSNHPELLDLIQ